MISQMFEAVTGVVPADVKTALRTSPAGGTMLRHWGERQTPGIRYISEAGALSRDDTWYAQIEAITGAEPHLLTKTREQLEPAARDGRVTLAIDTGERGRVVGCIILWDLGRDHTGAMWYELGTFVVVPDHRYKARGPKAMPIGDALYRRLLHTHRDKNILATTTNIHAIHIGQRHGMQMVSFTDLPPGIHRATCICPMDKTGATDNITCRIKDRSCRVRVPFPTWARIGYPQRLPYS